MRQTCVLGIAFAGAVIAAVPDIDGRNAQVPDHNTHFRMPAYSSRRAWEARKVQLRNQILSAAGLLPIPQKNPLRPTITKHVDGEGFSVEAVLLETLPGYYLGGNLYRPAGKKGALPAVLLPHGHWKRGRLEDLPSYSVPALGMNLAHQGYVVFAYDMVGFNDTRQTPHSFGGWDEMLWSFSPMGLQMWNGIRALDYLSSLPYVDKRRIAATGASGGATQTFLLAAVDDRIRYAAPVNMVSAHMQGGDPCEEAAGLRVDTSNVEIAATIAPRPMLIISSTRDWTRNTPVEEFPAIRSIYALYGEQDKVTNVHIDAEHNYNRQSREAAYRFLAAYMQPDLSPSQLADISFPTPPDEEMLASVESVDGRDLRNTAEVFDAWKVVGLLQRERNSDSTATREALRSVLRASWPEQVEAAIDGTRIVLTRPGTRERVTGSWRPGKGHPVIVVAPGGSAEALRTDPVAVIIRSGRPVFLLDPFQSGASRSLKERSYDYFYSYNGSDASYRVQDILTALSFVSQYGRPELMGIGEAGVWCIFAGAIASHDLDIIADLDGFGGSDEDFRDRFFVPGIQRAGGLSAALGLVGRMRAIVPVDAVE